MGEDTEHPFHPQSSERSPAVFLSPPLLNKDVGMQGREAELSTLWVLKRRSGWVGAAGASEENTESWRER